MSRTVELGRAVILSPSANVELWLTTLITVSPQQDSINLQQFNLSSLLDLLSSGKIWVGRGNGMHLDLDLTRHGEPIEPGITRKLSESILRAPVWNQLGLEPSLPDEKTTKNERVCININYAYVTSELKLMNQQRIFSDVPSRDTRPPGGVPRLDLESMRLCMDIVELKQTIKTAKQARTGLGMYDSLPDDAKEAKILGDEDENLLLFEKPCDIENTLSDPSSTKSLNRVHTLPCRKRKRNGRAESPGIRSNLLSRASSSQGSEHRTHSYTNIDLHSQTHVATFSPYVPDIDILVDGALRLSLCKSLHRSANGLKLKATTFTTGLAWIAPVLWSPGYLTALSERARFVPVVGSSLSRVAHKKARSMSLQAKLENLMKTAPTTSPQIPIPESHNDAHDRSVFVSISSLVWTYLQEHLPLKTTANHLQSFCILEDQSGSFSTSEKLAS